MHARLVERLLFVFVMAPLFHFIRYDLLIQASAVSLVLLLIRWLRTQNRSKFHMAGYVAPGWERVAEIYKNNLMSKQDQGSSFSVYHKGEPVVDLWGGYADPGSLTLRQEDSIGLFYSSTKAVAAIVLAMLSDRACLDYEAKVSSYWPEFGDQDKQDILVKTLVSHQGGLLAITDKHRLSLCKDDPDEMGRLLAKQKPMFKPGTGLGYHTLTLGLYVDQLVRRVDKQGRGLSDFFHQEIANKFDIDFYIGQPRHLHHRACRETRADFGLWFIFTTVLPVGISFLMRAIYSIIKYRRIYLLHLIGNPHDWKPRRLNDPMFREIPCGSSHGVGTARGLAKLMGILGNGGEHEGRRLLSRDKIAWLNTPLISAFDRVVLKNLTYGPGTVLQKVEEPNGTSHHIFGHWGAGGQMAYCDPEHQLGWAYNTNFSNIIHGFVMDHRYSSLCEAMYVCVRDLESSTVKS